MMNFGTTSLPDKVREGPKRASSGKPSQCIIGRI